MTARFLVGDVFEQVATLDDDSVDLAVTSPPFLRQRSYLPDDHPDKGKEIGSEADPAAFLDTLLSLAAALDRVITPHGSLVFELGDKYSGSGGPGGDYDEGGLRDGQPDGWGKPEYGDGWPLDKSLCMTPALFAASLAYGRNLLTGKPSLAGQWRIRNVIPWARPNPPVGALGDKWRPATSYVVVACRARDRWFDLDAVRTPSKKGLAEITGPKYQAAKGPNLDRGDLGASDFGCDPAGAPPLDWFMWDDPESEWSPDDGMWVIPTAPYAGAHYACWPPKLAHRIIDCMCPREVCRQCGAPRRRITGEPEYINHRTGEAVEIKEWQSGKLNRQGATGSDNGVHRVTSTLGWTDCGHGDYRPGLTLDPFAGSGTTLAVASGLGRDSIGIDLDERNADLAMERVGPLLLTVEYPERAAS